MTNSRAFEDLDLDGMKQLAEELASNLKVGSIVRLHGDLGAGKTTFAGFLINALLEKPEVITSPTFNLVHEYKTKKGKVYHFDLYRLKSSEELENIGIYEAFETGISIVEWPHVVDVKYFGNILDINIKSSLKSSNFRNLKINIE